MPHYFLAFKLIPSSITDYEKEQAERLKKHYQTINPLDTAPAHITIKAPFHRSKFLEETWENVRQYLITRPHSTITCEGLAHFNNTILYIPVHPDEQTKETLEEVRTILQQDKQITWSKHEINPIYHLTLAKRISSPINRILKETPLPPRVQIPIHNIHVFGKENESDPWNVRTFHYF